MANEILSKCCTAPVTYIRNGEISHYEEDGPVFEDIWECTKCYNNWTKNMRAKMEKMTSEHVCHALRCNVPVPPEMLMCKKHWFMVPKNLRDEVWRTYSKGQEVTKTPNGEYLTAMNAAIDAVAEQEGVPRYGK